MKEYKYTINGTKYEVAVGDIEENIVTVTVNGEEYKVEMSSCKQEQCRQGSPAWCYHRHQGCRRRRSSGWRYHCRT